MPIKMSFIENLCFNHLNLAPGILADYFTAMGFRVVEAAINLGVFEALDKEGALTAEEVASKLKTGRRGTYLLLEALESLKYLKKKGDSYRNSQATCKWLLKNSPHSIYGGIRFYKRLLFNRWESLEQSIRNDGPADNIWEWLDKFSDGWELFQEGMIAGAQLGADELFSYLKFPEKKGREHRLLDIGGGHGVYSIKACVKNNHVKATIFDWAKSAAIGRKMVAGSHLSSHLSEKIDFIEGDFEKDPLPHEFDSVFLFSIIHGYREEKIKFLFEKVKKTLNVEGRIIILDLMTDDPNGAFSKTISKLMGLTLFNDVGGETHSFENVKKWLKIVGFKNVKKRKLLKSPYTVIQAEADSL